MATLGRLMSPVLPQTIEPLRLARAGKKLSGQIPLSVMRRLTGLLHDDHGLVSFSLDFARDDAEKAWCITGAIETVLHTQCQRCLGLLNLQLNNRISLGIVTSRAEADALPDKYEPLFLDEDETIVLASLIEDELLLAIPISPMHATDECEETPILDAMKEESGNKPFADLKKMTQKMR